MTNRAMQHSECGPVTFSRHTSPHTYYLAHAQISPSGVTGERERKKASLVDVDPLLPVTTCRRNSSDEANSRVLFPLDSVPRADSGGRAFGSSLSGSLSQGEIRRGSCAIAGLSCPEMRVRHARHDGDTYRLSILGY